jgi:hypothetical protein
LAATLQSLQRQELLKSRLKLQFGLSCANIQQCESQQVVARLCILNAIKPGISASASSTFLPQAAREISFTLKATKGIVVVLIYSIFVIVNFAKLRNIFRITLISVIFMKCLWLIF